MKYNFPKKMHRERERERERESFRVSLREKGDLEIIIGISTLRLEENSLPIYIYIYIKETRVELCVGVSLIKLFTLKEAKMTKWNFLL